VSGGLSVRNLCVSYGGVHALSSVDLVVRPGELVGLIGPNGAGKTTFIDAVTGFAQYDGQVELDGADLTGLPPHARARRGLARTWQSIELFDGLTVAENIAVADSPRSGWATLRETFRRPTGLSGDIEKTLALLELEARVDTQAGDLSQGERKLVGVARALAGRPRIVCLDEPAAGLDSDESAQLGKRLRTVVEAGTGMLLIDHDMALVLEVSDTVVVLDFGKVIASGPPSVVRNDQRVIAAYLGGTAKTAPKEAL
jgi:branched-chain amino acid transport system ATP-binding protein